MKTVALAILMVALCSAQTAPRFDAVSIRPNTSDEHGGGMRPIAGGFSARNLSATMLIQTAYNVKVWQLSGGPGWTTSDRYDIEAKAARNPTFEEKRQMLQPLLADRFHLKFHRETRQMTIYSLTVAKNGLKLESTPSDVRGYFRPGRGLFEGRSVNIKTLGDFLAGNLERQVTDNTGVTGAFDIRLEWASSEVGLDATNKSSIFTAIQEQLGLKLEAGKGPVEVFVIDHIEKPSEN